ncbi:MAG: NmrA family NAD(P)-binding protein, partial [Bacteroidetes bacterium]|nr:NmrA family NAD(P)-binding protein [Bacteroidota bacterium]
MKPKILITGATGTTGQYAIQKLVEKGADVRAMVRTIDERSDALEELGVEVVQSDFLDLQGLRKALNNVNRAYFLYPFIDHLPKAAGYFAKAAKEQNVELVVSMSQMNVHEGTTSPATQNHLIAEDILDWADIGAVHIRPALFAWNYLGMAAPTVKGEKKFYFPNPEAKYTIIHPQDIGEVVAEILTDENIRVWLDVLDFRLIVENDSRMKFPYGCFVGTTVTLLGFLAAFCISTIIIGRMSDEGVAESNPDKRIVKFEFDRLAIALGQGSNALNSNPSFPATTQLYSDYDIA